MSPILGKTSLVTVYGEYWKKVRKVFNPAFAVSHLETLVPGMIEESMEFIHILEKYAKSGEEIKLGQRLPVKSVSRVSNIGFDDGCYRKVSLFYGVNIDIRVLFNIRLKTQTCQNDMATSLAKLVQINDQTSILSDYRIFNPIYHLQQYLAQRSPPTPVIFIPHP